MPERCGQLSAMHLDALIGRRPVSCQAVGTDQNGRTLGICYHGDRNLDGPMVRDGHAVAYRRYARRYVSAETTHDGPAEACGGHSSTCHGTGGSGSTQRHLRSGTSFPVLAD